ncbi:VOC family protein [Nonomuraea ferruginea]|uniref:VOC family protein n=1 Tax=Nonomuraea ferruginea TaxID=46174 RepID=A0ABT4T9H4_9ACTN|nr:VOC family protein [Nonomuraea ferruginea]MDA0645990.1 VOC family protein [Nonomuraea ferruginea]
MPKKITPFLMFEGRAQEAIDFYLKVFDDAEVISVVRYGPGEPGPEGSIQLAHLRVCGQEFLCNDSYVSHAFTFTPSLSLFVECESEEEIDRLYPVLSEQGGAMMPLGQYGFSAKFAWVADQFGVSWQLNLP